MNHRTLYLALAVTALSLWAVCAPSASAAAATLSLTPSTGSYTVGQTISLTVIVSSPDTSVNAISGSVSFPADRLQVTSLVKSGSIVSIWAEEPSYSNTQGTVSFEGVILNPGFQGSYGKVLTINLRVKAGASASLAFLSGSVLANDGQGTNVLEASRGAHFTLGERGTPPQSSSPLPLEGTVPTETVSSSSDAKTVAPPPRENFFDIQSPAQQVGRIGEWTIVLLAGAISLALIVGVLVFAYGRIALIHRRYRLELVRLETTLNRDSDRLIRDLRTRHHLKEDVEALEEDLTSGIQDIRKGT